MTRYGITHKRPDFSVKGSEELFNSTSKKSLWVALKHLCAADDNGGYDASLETGSWLYRMIRELQNTRESE
jgi:hypothetical protein